MATNTETTSAPGALFNPLSGWEAATRWNAATFDWMARGFQQWIALMTVIPPHAVTTAARPVAAERAAAGERPIAHAAARRSTARHRTGSKTSRAAKPRARG